MTRQNCSVYHSCIQLMYKAHLLPDISCVGIFNNTGWWSELVLRPEGVHRTQCALLESCPPTVGEDQKQTQYTRTPRTPLYTLSIQRYSGYYFCHVFILNVVIFICDASPYSNHLEDSGCPVFFLYYELLCVVYLIVVTSCSVQLLFIH